MNILILLACVYPLLCLAVYVFQRQLIYFPSPDIVLTPKQVDLEYEEVRLTASDGASLYGWYVAPENARGCLIFFHGNAGNISDRLDPLQMYYQMGMAVVMIDYRGYGKSKGSPSEKGLYLDAEAAWRFATFQKSWDAARIIVTGRSLGSGPATWLAQKFRGGGLILENAFTSMTDMGRKQYPFLPVSILVRDRYDNESRIGAVQQPTLITHSRQDSLIPYELGETLFAAASEPKQFLGTRGGHNDGREGHPEYREAIEAFLDECLPD